MKPVGSLGHQCEQDSQGCGDTPVVAALRFQVSEHLSPGWNVDANQDSVPSGQAPAAEKWQLILGDDPDIDGDSRYHNVSPPDRDIARTPDGFATAGPS
jgi:hypothetical protein